LFAISATEPISIRGFSIGKVDVISSNTSKFVTATKSPRQIRQYCSLGEIYDPGIRDTGPQNPKHAIMMTTFLVYFHSFPERYVMPYVSAHRNEHIAASSEIKESGALQNPEQF
jgi:spore germination protein YaaH